MTTYRNALPTELELPSLALGRPLDPHEVFESDVELADVHVDVKQGETWRSSVSVAEAAAAEAAAAEADEAKPARRARRTAKRSGGRS